MVSCKCSEGQNEELSSSINWMLNKLNVAVFGALSVVLFACTKF